MTPLALAVGRGHRDSSPHQHMKGPGCGAIPCAGVGRSVGWELVRDDPDVLSPGQPAPPFDLPDHLGGRVRLDELLGSWILLWWYPKASTPG